MTYEFLCEKCNMVRIISRPMAKSSDPAHCDMCGKAMQRIYTPPQIIGAKVFEAEYSPAFGKVFKSKREKQYEIDKTGAIEVGTEKIERIEKDFSKNREEKRKQRWDKED